MTVRKKVTRKNIARKKQAKNMPTRKEEYDDKYNDNSVRHDDDNTVVVDNDTQRAMLDQVKGTPVPDSIMAPKKKTSESSGIEVGESFFARHHAGFDPGRARSGLILDRRNYCNSDTDRDGVPVEYRFGSRRPGFPVRNANRGYVQARVNEKGELDPDGKPVNVSGMALLVRKKEHGDVMRKLHKEQTLRSTKKKRNEESEVTKEALRGLAKRLGVEEHLIEREHSEEKVFEPKHED